MYGYVEKIQTRKDSAKSEKTRLKNNLSQCRNYDEANLDDSIAAIEQSKIVLLWIENALKSPMIQDTMRKILEERIE